MPPHTPAMPAVPVDYNSGIFHFKRQVTGYNPEEILTNLHGWRVKRSDINLIHMISSGDAGEVWKAEVNGKVCAAKVMKLLKQYNTVSSAMADQAYKDLVAELAAMDTIKPHPNIVEFYGACVENRTEPILLEEFVEGESLKMFLEKSMKICGKAYRPPRQTVYGWILHLFKALDHLHSSDPIIIHRDIKPANVLLAKNMQVLKLTDFGTAKRVTRTERDTMIHTGRKSGNIMYMAPEVYDMMQGHYDERCDVYSAGLLSWRIATGKAIHPRSEWESSEWRPDLDMVQWPALEAILEKAWMHAANMRPSAKQIIMELMAIPDKPDIVTLGIAPVVQPGCVCSVQ